MKILIDRVKHVPTDALPDQVMFYYMHDCHVFSRLYGTTIDDVLAIADIMAKESPCGMLCPPILLLGDKELYRLEEVAHAPCLYHPQKWENGKILWRRECESDKNIIRLMSSKLTDSQEKGQ